MYTQFNKRRKTLTKKINDYIIKKIIPFTVKMKTRNVSMKN